jgi:GNAT superfamily N-acetyltransferase
MGIRVLTNRARIETLLRRHPELHIYGLGDLDDFFWPWTTWYGWEEEGELRDIVLIYNGQALATVIALSDRPTAMQELLREVAPLLPRRFYAHLSLGVEDALRETHQINAHGPHHKMALRDSSHVANHDSSQVVRLNRGDLADLVRLYEEGYPANWFDPRMLDTGQYFGLRSEGSLVSAAGAHVYSERYRVAAIGNVVTHPAHRNRGYGRLVTARLCQSLLEKVEHVGLNVKTDNEPAIACYRRLGFEVVASYGEFMVEEKS